MHCPGITIEDVRKSDLLADMTNVLTELAFTLAKNATKPNPFEIIPLQTTRKDNNWKNEEALA